MNKLVKDALILTLITLIAGFALGMVYEVTKKPIEAANLATIQAAYRSLFPEGADFGDETGFDAEKATAYVNDKLAVAGVNGFTAGDLDIKSHIKALSGDGKVLGDIITVTSHKGYGGDITLSVGIGADGKLTGYKITAISETPGLGMKSTEERFSSLFRGEDADRLLIVTKMTPTVGEIEAISGATITSRAVTNAVNAAIAYHESANGNTAPAASDEGGEADE